MARVTDFDQVAAELEGMRGQVADATQLLARLRELGAQLEQRAQALETTIARAATAAQNLEAEGERLAAEAQAWRQTRAEAAGAVDEALAQVRAAREELTAWREKTAEGLLVLVTSEARALAEHAAAFEQRLSERQEAFERTQGSRFDDAIRAYELSRQRSLAFEETATANLKALGEAQATLAGRLEHEIKRLDAAVNAQGEAVDALGRWRDAHAIPHADLAEELGRLRRRLAYGTVGLVVLALGLIVVAILATGP